MKKYIPIGLVILRLLIGFLIVAITLINGEENRVLVVSLVLFGFVADIFDGIIARQLGISTSGLRVWDTNVDRVFWLLVLFSCYHLDKAYVSAKLPIIASVLSIEVLIYSISFFRFGKTPSPHNLLTKLWGISIAVSLTEILLGGTSSMFYVMIIIGFISRLDSLLIYCILKEWDHDIPSCYHALKLKEGKKIKRLKLFNG